MADRIGKYELREILGKGAMGIVYEGFDPMIGRRLAIKTVRIPDQDDLDAQDELARFKREAQAAGRLSHPNIVSVFDYGETSALAYIVMEYVDGATLKQALDRNERFPLPEIVRMMRGLLAGLHYSHERGIVHRDIKPANVMRTQSGEIKIADFGIARIESSSLTQAGTMMGTPSYMSPEQFMGQTVDFRTDIYSAGVVLYQLLTGEKPFDGGLTAIMHKVLHTEPPPPSALSVTVPLAFDAVVQKAMAKLPSSRFASAAEFATSLQDAFQPKPEIPTGRQASAFADDEPTLLAATPPLASAANPLYLPIAAPPASMPEKKGFPKLAVASVAGALLMVAAAAIYLTGHQQPAPATPAPVPPAPVAAAPAVTPQPAPLPVMAAQRDAILQSRFGALPCTLIGAVDAGGKLRLTGLAGAGAPQAAFTAALASLPAGITPQSTVQPFEGPYCAALDAIRPYNVFLSQPGAELGLGLNGGISILHDGQLMTVKEKMPSYVGYLQTDYFSGDGTVRHLYPTAADPLTKLPAESRKVLGNPKKGGASWKVSAPFGAKMIISIVTTSPLFPNLRPPNETASDYLPALRQALQNAASNNSNLDVAAVQLITEPKQ